MATTRSRAATSAEGAGDPVCIIGAGSSGLAGAHRLMEQGFRVEVVERTDDVGGLWNFGSPAGRVFATTQLVTSKRMTEYPDFPMPAAYPDYPSHRQAQAYLRAYAQHFGVWEHIRFGVGVTAVDRAADGRGWDVTTDDGTTRRYRAVVVANGHNWSPRWPDFPGTFTGHLLHAAEYRDAELLRGKRVVVVGGGNSGCDIVCDAATVGARAVHSVRRGYHVIPKYVFGMPIDQWAERFSRRRVPLGLRRAVGRLVLKVSSQELWRHGYPRPDHRLWETHPVINTQLAHHVTHGRITPKPDIARFDGPDVVFTDGSRVTADVVVLASGYRIELPFLGPRHLEGYGHAPRLYLNLFSPRHDDLFFLGLTQPSQGQWQLVDHQARVVAAYLRAQRERPDRAARLRARTAGPVPHLGGGVRYVRSPRHALELEHVSYRRRLDRILRQLDVPGTQRTTAAIDAAGTAALMAA